MLDQDDVGAKGMGGEAEGLPVLFQKQILESRLRLVALFALGTGRGESRLIHFLDEGTEVS